MSEQERAAGREAAARRDWGSAFVALAAADQDGPLAAEDLEVLGLDVEVSSMVEALRSQPPDAVLAWRGGISLPLPAFLSSFVGARKG